MSVRKLFADLTDAELIEQNLVSAFVFQKEKNVSYGSIKNPDQTKGDGTFRP